MLSLTNYRAVIMEPGVAALLGVLAGLGQPGFKLPFLFFISYITFCLMAVRSPSWPRLISLSVIWGTVLMVMVFLGTKSWGMIVPATLVVGGIVFYALPIGWWVRWASRYFNRQWQLFVATIGFWGAWQELLDIFDLPYRGALLALTHMPDLLAGVRLVGTSVLEGLVLAVCLWVAAVLASPVRSIRARLLRASSILGVGLLVLGLLSILAHSLASTPGQSISVGIPQINIGRDYYEGRMLNHAADRLFAKRFDKMLNGISNVDLMVTTETYDGRFGLLFDSTRDRWSSWSADNDNSVLVSSFLVNDIGQRINAMAGFSRGKWIGVHEKIDLAPFGETSLAAGTIRKPLALSSDIQVGVLICNEALLRKPGRELVDDGANLLVATVNDVSFGSSVVTFGHLAQTKLRAIELGRDIIWASNAGPSGVIDRWGQMQPQAPFRRPVAIRANAELNNKATFLHSFPWLPITVCILMLLTVVGLRQPSHPSRVVYPVRDKSIRFASFVAVTGVILSVVIIIASPALVEIQSGEPRRAKLAIQETWQQIRFLSDKDPYLRFNKLETAELSAIAYFLEYFGSDIPAENLSAKLGQDVSFKRLIGLFEQQIGLRSRSFPANSRMIPRVAALTRLADGRLVVINQPKSNDPVSVFDAATGQANYISSEKFKKMGPLEFLIPIHRKESPNSH